MGLGGNYVITSNLPQSGFHTVAIRCVEKGHVGVARMNVRRVPDAGRNKKVVTLGNRVGPSVYDQIDPSLKYYAPLRFVTVFQHCHVFGKLHEQCLVCVGLRNTCSYTSPGQLLRKATGILV